MWRRPDLWLNCCKGKKLFSFSAFSQGELHVLPHFSTLTLAYYCDAHRNLSFHYTSSRSCPGPTYFNCAYKQSTMAVHDDVIVKPSFQSEYSYPTARFIRIKRQYAEKKWNFSWISFCSTGKMCTFASVKPEKVHYNTEKSAKQLSNRRFTPRDQPYHLGEGTEHKYNTKNDYAYE